MPPSLSPADWTQLEQYADGALPPAARAALENRLTTDAELRAALLQHQQIVTALRAEGRAALRQRLQRLDAELGPPMIIPATPAAALLRVSWRAQWGRRLAVAASAVLVITAGVLLRRQPDAPALVARYGIPDPGLPVLMSEVIAPTRALVNQAMNAYKLGDYPAALATWQQLPADAVGRDTMLYYTGIFQLSAEQSAEAAKALEEVKSLPTSAFRQRADYYFALALWSQGRTREAQEAFARLAAQTNHPFAAAAQRALPHISE